MTADADYEDAITPVNDTYGNDGDDTVVYECHREQALINSRLQGVDAIITTAHRDLHDVGKRVQVVEEDLKQLKSTTDPFKDKSTNSVKI